MTDPIDEAHDLLGGPTIHDPGRFGVAIDYAKAFHVVSDLIRERNELREAARPFADPDLLTRITIYHDGHDAGIVFLPNGARLPIEAFLRLAALLKVQS